MSEPSDTAAIVLDVDGESTERCLRSLLAQSIGFHEIIVVDNGSSMLLRDRLEADLLDRVRLIRLETNTGFTGGVNRAMQEVQTKFVALINNDVVLDPEWTAVLLSHFGDSNLCAAQTILLDRSGNIDGAGIEITGGRVRQLAHHATLQQFDSAKFWAVSATAAIYRCDSLRSVAFGDDILHPEFFAYYEDVELAARLHAAGFTMHLVPQPLATHEGSASASILGARALLLRVRNRYFVSRLHPMLLSRPSLLVEDARRAVRALLQLRIGHVWAITRGLVAGICGALTASSPFSRSSRERVSVK